MGTTAELSFSDGVVIKVDGPYRAVKLPDGWYVVGRGVSIPCDSRQEALDAVRELRG